MSRLITISVLLLFAACSQAAPPQKQKQDPASQKWVDSVFNRLSEDERIGQLFMVAAYSGGPNYNAPKIEALIRSHQIGGLIFMQGGPVRQALLTNRFQQMAQVPLLLAMDTEWGLGMRLDSVINLPKQMTLGAANDTGIAYAMGAAVAYQCNRIGVHVNFAPVVDVNNNPANPVINARSFGEDKYRVARLGVAYMKGMQDNGVMACAKHFPGHGDVSVDSHLDLPVINKTRSALDSLELFPFRELIRAGVQSVMIAHLSVPVLEAEPHVPTTLSKNTVTGVLKTEMGFKGLTFTDALDMKGLTKYFSAGEADARAFIAGNDVLLFSQDVPVAITKIKTALKAGTVSASDLELRVKKILAAKYHAGLNHFKPVNTANITEDINQFAYPFNSKVADAAITVVRDRGGLLPFRETKTVMHIILNGPWPGAAGSTRMAGKSGYYQSIKIAKGGSLAPAEAQLASSKSDIVLISVHGLSFYPGKSYGLDDAMLRFLKEASGKPNVIIALMGNAYALRYVCDAGTLICGYEDNLWTATALENLLGGTLKARGRLPVTPPCLH